MVIHAVGKKRAIFDRLVFTDDSNIFSTVEELMVFKIAGFSLSLNQDNSFFSVLLCVEVCSY